MRPLRDAPELVSIGESAKLALDTLWTHKLRASLTILGIIIGVTAIAAMTSLVRGLDLQVVGELRDIGSDHLFIRKYAGRIITDEREWLRLERRPDITVSDAEAIAALPSVADSDIMVGAAFPARLTISWRNQQTDQDVFGTTPRYPTINASDIEEGRYFSSSEVANGARVAVIGPGIADALFGPVDPVGKDVRIGGLKYRVVGIFEERIFLISGQSKDNRVVVPYTSYHRDFESRAAGRPVDDPDMDILLTVVPAAKAGVERARDDITFLMRARHKLRPGEENDFDIVDQSSFLELWDQITGSVFLTMVVISSIALLVGGIGVMNIMLVSVTERTREIGVRKALGARRRDILWQFLVEAAVMTGIGGVFGVLVGGALAIVVSNLIGLPVAMSATSFVIGVGASSAIGIFFGLWPASKAARLDPIDALRYE